MELIHWSDFAALSYMLVAWCAYAVYVRRRAKAGKLPSLSRGLTMHRRAWVQRMLKRDMRMTDASLLGNQERVVGFFASSTLLLLAAIFTAISSSNLISEMAAQLPFAEPQSPQQVQFKLFVLALVLIYAFFTVTWSLRQYGFVNILMGAAPLPEEDLDGVSRKRYVDSLVKLLDRAGHDNNSALRAYYFCLAMLFWLFHIAFFVVATTLIIGILYHRECSSAAVRTMEMALIEAAEPA